MCTQISLITGGLAVKSLQRHNQVQTLNMPQGWGGGGSDRLDLKEQGH